MTERTYTVKEIERLERDLADANDRTRVVLEALDESVKLQSHYAECLNMYDGGHRMQFASASAWIDRLRSLKLVS